MHPHNVIYLTSLFLGSVFATLLNPLPPSLPILKLRYPNTPWISPGDTILMSGMYPLRIHWCVQHSTLSRYASSAAYQQLGPPRKLNLPPGLC